MYDPFCPMCGYENDQGAPVCLKCGSPLEEEEPIDGEPSVLQDEKPKAPEDPEDRTQQPEHDNKPEVKLPSTPEKVKSEAQETEVQPAEKGQISSIKDKTTPDKKTDGATTIIKEDNPPAWEPPSPDKSKDEEFKGTKLLNNRFKKIRVAHRARKSVIYQALDTNTGDMVAVKEMEDRFGSDYDRQVAIKAFREEAKRLMRLSNPGLPKIIDFFQQDDKYYVIKQFIEGENFKNRMTNRGNKPYDEQLIIKWILQIIEILSYLHKQSPKFIYKIMKPSNIQVDNNDQVYLIDYDIDRIFTPKSKDEDRYPSSFAAPELKEGFSDPRSDAYSLGMLVRYLFTGIDPDDKSRYTRYKRIRDVNDNISGWLDNLVLEMVSHTAQQRPATLEKVRTRILEHEDAEGKTTPLTEKKLESASPLRPKTEPVPTPVRTSPELSDIRVSPPVKAQKTDSKVSREWLGLGIIIMIPLLLIGLIVAALVAPGIIAGSHINKGDSYMKAKEYRRALESYKKAHESKKSGKTFMKMADAHYGIGDYKESVTNYLTAIDKNGKLKPQIDKKLAMAYMKQGKKAAEAQDYLTAGNCFEQAIRFNPELEEIDDRETLLLRGKSFEANKKYDLARKDYDRVIEMDPKNAEAYRGRGMAFLLQGNVNKATQDLNMAKKLDKKYLHYYQQAMDTLARQYINTALKLTKNRKHDDALKELKKVDNILSKTSPSIKQELSNAYISVLKRKGYRANALEIIQITTKALELSPVNMAALKFRAAAYLKLADYEKALTDYNTSLKYVSPGTEKKRLEQQIKYVEQRIKFKNTTRQPNPVTTRNKFRNTPVPTASRSPVPQGNSQFFVVGKGSASAILGRKGTTKTYIVQGSGGYYLPEKEWIVGDYHADKVILWIKRYNRMKSYRFSIRELERLTVVQLSKTRRKVKRYYRTVYKVTLRRSNNKIISLDSSYLYRRLRQGETVYAEVTLNKVKIYAKHNDYRASSYSITGGGGIY